MTAHAGAPTDSGPIARALVRAHGVLPDQGPIGVFIHHNTLHAFQHLPFHEAVETGADELRARPYLSLPEFREHLRSGRIADADVRTEIGKALGRRAAAPVLGAYTRAELWHTLMAAPCEIEDAAGLAYTVRIGQAEPCGDRARWDACVTRAARGPALPATDDRTFRRHRDVLIALGAADTDQPIHGELVRLASAFLDHGQSHAPLPGREQGFLRAVAELYAPGVAAPRACRGAEADLREIAVGRLEAIPVIDAALRGLGIEGDEVEPFTFATALALPGWAGMFARLERHAEEHERGLLPTLADFVAVRLTFERRAVEQACADLGIDSHWRTLRHRIPSASARPSLLDAYLLWQVARAAGISAAQIEQLDDEALGTLWNECLAFPEIQRRRLFLDAFERTYRRMILDAVAARHRLGSAKPASRPRAQFVFCIDEREESIRRALEEQQPDYVTFGAAGFFGVAIDYQGLYDDRPAAHCPVVVTPAHEVHEAPTYTELGWHHQRRSWRDRWHALERRAAAASRTLSGGAGVSLLWGPISGILTSLQVMAPWEMDTVSARVMGMLAPRPKTRLSALRPQTDAILPESGKPVGFSLDESIDRVTAVLRSIGLVSDIAPIVVLLGHGSTSLNNPHESAHDCGACGGRRGGANARLFAALANRHDVRHGVRNRGIDIPADTWFLGALHDTADDSVTYFDLDQVPPWHAGPVDDALHALELARRENALERSRRFDNASLMLTPDLGLRHVEIRSKLYAQPRPEYGHCTNAICIVGRRGTTRGLHLDRRAFLVSYDPTIDVDEGILERILAAVGPVGAGISLEYYFSAVDNEVFGCGTKLPHNVTGLIGVMNGHQSDLRTGLPLQMVEIHEAMRLLLIVEATPAALLTVAGRQPEVAELVVNQWVQLVSMDPATGAMQVFEDGTFVPYVPAPVELPVVESSADWHMRSRKHLPPALVRRGLPSQMARPLQPAMETARG